MGKNNIVYQIDLMFVLMVVIGVVMFVRVNGTIGMTMPVNMDVSSLVHRAPLGFATRLSSKRADSHWPLASVNLLRRRPRALPAGTVPGIVGLWEFD